MNPFRAIIEWLTTKPRERSIAGGPDLFPIDTKKIANDIGLQAEAKRLAEMGLPPQNQTEITGVESKIVQVINSARLNYNAWATYRLQVINTHIKRLDPTRIVNEGLEAHKEFELKAGALLDKSSPVLNHLKSEYKDTKEEWFVFRVKNQLNTSPIYPSASRQRLLFSVLAALVLFEGISNAYFFSKGIESGLVGGFFYAAFFSVLNVAVAYRIGRYAFPYMNHVSAPKKLLGILSLVIFFILSVTIALGIAHFRDMLSYDVENAAKNALAKFKTDPLGLEEIYSWVLFGISILCAIVAATDAYNLDDPYPGYGRLHRRLLTSKDNLMIEVQNVREELQSLKVRALQSLENAAQTAEERLHELNEEIEKKKATESGLKGGMTNAQYCLDTLIKCFRDENRMARNNVAVPDYFNTHPILQEVAIPRFDIDADIARWAKQAEYVNKLTSSIQSIRASILASFGRRYDSLAPMDGQV